MRVTQYLADQQIAFEEVLHPPAFTSQKLAHSLHISGRRVVKSVLLKGPKGFVVSVLPAAQMIDLTSLTPFFGGPARLATVDELRAQFLDCEFGAVMPFGRLYGLTSIFEATIPLDATIYFEAQLHAVAIKMQCRDYVRLERPERLHFVCDRVTPEQRRPRAG